MRRNERGVKRVEKQHAGDSKTTEATRAGPEVSSRRPAVGPDTPWHPILHLQRTIGNRGVERLLQAGQLQHGGSSGQPGDALEHEADRVAAQVVQMPPPGLSRPSAIGAAGADAGQPGSPDQADVAASTIDTAVANSVTRALGPGQPLDHATRAFFASRFGSDFSHVRVHTDARAAASAQTVHALAYTMGRDIVFDTGQYAPGTLAGDRLLAHELAHVVQQQRLPMTTGVPPAVQRQGRPAPTHRSNILRPGENFRWTGPTDAPVLVIRKSWLVVEHRVPANARMIDGQRFPAVLTAVLTVLLDRYPWTARNRDAALGRIAALGIAIPATQWVFDELEINLAHSVFQIIGLPPEAPIQVFPQAHGLDVYVDLSTLYAPDMPQEAIEALKPAIAERVVAKIEQTVGHSIEAVRRVQVVDWIRARLHSARHIEVFPFSARDLQVVFGEVAWNEYLAQRPAGPAQGVVLQVSGGGYVLPADIPLRDQEIVQGLLRELFGRPPAGAPPATSPRPLSHADVQALLQVAADPNRQQILNNIRAARHQRQVTGVQSVAELLEIARAQADLRVSARALNYTLPESDPTASPIVTRPVRGRILNMSGALVPRMEGKFTFETLDQVDALRVPHVDIQWFAIRQGAARGERPVRTERTSYIEVRDDSILNDREFTVTFEREGIYEIHAFVNHNFYLPAHFSIPVEVKTEQQRLREQQAETSASFGQVGPARAYRFEDVARQNLLVEIGLGVVAGPLIAVPISALRPDDTTGLRSEGTLSREAFGTPGGSLALGHRQLQQQIEQLDRLIAQYRSQGTVNDDLRQWAEERRARLIATRDRLTELAGSTDNKPIMVQGNYVTRVAGARSGPLNLVAWFTYTPGASGAPGTYHGHLFDHSELVRNEDFHFRESDQNYATMMERLFFALTRTYPNGLMSFSFQIYEGLTPTQRFMRFERVTDTLLNDVRNAVFAEPVSITVNIVATVLSVFPPTAPIGISISIAYNGANALLNFADAVRTDTVRATNYIDIGMVALDAIPLLGKATRVVRIGETSYRVLNAAQHAGMAYMFTEGAFQQIQQLRDGLLTDLARKREEIAELERTNPSDPRLSAMRQEAADLERRIRNAATDVFTDMAVHQGLTIASQHAISRAAAAHFETRPGTRPLRPGDVPLPRDLPGGGEPGGPRLPGVAEPSVEPGITRARGEAVHTGRVHVDSDPALAGALPSDLQGRIAVRRGPPPEAHEVRVYYQTDSLGLITEVHIAAGPNVLPVHIAQHVQTVRLMERYRGVSGAIRILFERLRALVARRGAPPVPGSAVFEASLEVEKLPRIIRERAELLRHQGLDPEVRRDLEADLTHLQAELERHRRTLDRAEMEQGVGFVAATVPRSNAAARASGRPEPPPGHYYYEPTPGVFELRRFVWSTEPEKQLVFDNGQWRIVDREARRGFQSFLEIQLGSFPEPLADHPRVEAVIARRFGSNQLDQGGVAIARRWGDTLRALHDGAGPGGNALLERLMGELGAVTTDTSYGNFRRAVRQAMVDQALAQPHPPGGADQRVTRLRTLLDTLPDPRSQGEVFTLFRERLSALEGSPLSFMQPIPGADPHIPNGRAADGAVHVTQQVAGGPPPGRYLAEDKSGANPFNPEQAQRYHEQLRDPQNNGTMRTTDGQVYAGIIYTFDSQPAAEAALNTIRGLHPHIRVGYFNPEGRFVWLR